MSSFEALRREFAPQRGGLSADKTFVTFCAGAEAYYAAGLRLCRQVRSGGLFSRVVCYTDADLREDTAYWARHGDFISRNRRGFGYWIWKPYVVSKELERSAEGGVVMYLDAGCEYNPGAQAELQDAFRRLASTPLLSARGIPEWAIIRWTKRDLLAFFDADRPNVHAVHQCQAGAILMRKCGRVMACVGEWLRVCSEHHRLIDDSRSVHALPEHPQLEEHRHDQSVYNLCLLKHGLFGADLPYSQNRQDRRHAILYIRNCPRYKPA